MGTNPNFPPRDAPPIDTRDEAPPDPSKPRASEPTKDDGEQDSDSRTFNSERFGIFTLPPDFLREAWKIPLPRAKDEDLLKDTIPPHASLDPSVGTGIGSETGADVQTDHSGSLVATPTRTPPTRKRDIRLLVIGLIVLAFVVGGVLALIQKSGEGTEVEIVRGEKADERASVVVLDRPRVEPSPEKEASVREEMPDPSAKKKADSVPPSSAEPKVTKSDPNPVQESIPAATTAPASDVRPSPKPTSGDKTSTSEKSSNENEKLPAKSPGFILSPPK